MLRLLPALNCYYAVHWISLFANSDLSFHYESDSGEWGVDVDPPGAEIQFYSGLHLQLLPQCPVLSWSNKCWVAGKVTTDLVFIVERKLRKPGSSAFPQMSKLGPGGRAAVLRSWTHTVGEGNAIHSVSLSAFYWHTGTLQAHWAPHSAA